MNTFSSSKNTRRGHTAPPVGHLPPKSGHRKDRPSGRTSEQPAEAGWAGAFASALFAMPFVLVIGVLFLLICTLVAFRSDDPHVLVMPLSLAALGLTSLMGGLISARRRRGNPLLSGLLCGLFINLLLLGLSLFFGESTTTELTLGYSGLAKWGLHAAATVLSVLGAKFGAGKKY